MSLICGFLEIGIYCSWSYRRNNEEQRTIDLAYAIVQYNGLVNRGFDVYPALMHSKIGNSVL